MKELTAVFMDVLGQKTGQESRAADIVRESMLLELSERTRELSSSTTLFFSEKGHKIRQDIMILQKKAGSLERAGKAAALCRQLRAVFIRAEQLHRETQREIHKAGHIRVEKLHFFYENEQAEALDILEKFIKVELFRILVLGGGKMFSSLKPLKGYQYTLQDRMKYLQSEILPVTGSIDFRQRVEPRYWTIAHSERVFAGPMGILPGYVAVEPVKIDHRFLPGEHRMLPKKNDIVLQGFGHLTNVRPESVEKAQGWGALYSEILPVQLEDQDSLQDPDAVLNRVFSGAYYVIDPAQYFSAASYVEASRAVTIRSRIGKCLLCAQPSGREFFCERCRKRIKIP